MFRLNPGGGEGVGDSSSKADWPSGGLDRDDIEFRRPQGPGGREPDEA